MAPLRAHAARRKNFSVAFAVQRFGQGRNMADPAMGVDEELGALVELDAYNERNGALPDQRAAFDP